jgi:hypothetical protein
MELAKGGVDLTPCLAAGSVRPPCSVEGAFRWRLVGGAECGAWVAVLTQAAPGSSRTTARPHHKMGAAFNGWTWNG